MSNTPFVEDSSGFHHTLTEREKLKIMGKNCTALTYTVEIRRQMLDANGACSSEIAAIHHLVHIANGPKEPKGT